MRSRAVVFGGATVLYLMVAGGAACSRSSPRSDAQVAREFHELWYRSPTTWKETRWMGILTGQNPMDVWVTQEIIFEVKPDVIVECGSFRGGSAALWATLLSQVNPDGRVISIDIQDTMQAARQLPIVQKYVTFLVGSSTAPDIVAEVTRRAQGKKVLVILDSDHRMFHVAAELRAYSPIVPVGGYIIVQDTNINGHPVFPTHGPGPREAVAAFMATNKSFESDRGRERLLFTFNETGFLRRVQ